MKKTKYTNLEFKFAQDNDEGKLIGYGSKFGNVDYAGDVIEKGAFTKTIKDTEASGKKFKFLYQHDQTQPIGVIETIKEDSNGLYIEVQLNMEVQKAREAYALAKQGALDGLSVGFNIVKENYDMKGIRTIKEARLWEVSLVTFPCNDQATLTAIKAQFDETSDEEMPVEDEVVDEVVDDGNTDTNPETLLNGLRDLAVSGKLPETLNTDDWVFLLENLISLWNAAAITANDGTAETEAEVGAKADEDATDTEAEIGADAQTEEPLDDELSEEDIKKYMALFSK